MARTVVTRYPGPPAAAVDALFEDVPGLRDEGKEPLSIGWVGDELVAVFEERSVEISAG